MFRYINAIQSIQSPKQMQDITPHRNIVNEFKGDTKRHRNPTCHSKVKSIFGVELSG